MSRSNSLHLLFIIGSFCLCCLFVYIEGEYQQNRWYQFFPLLLEKYKTGHVPGAWAKVLGFKIFLLDGIFADDVSLWYAIPFDRNKTKIEFKNGENFTNHHHASADLHKDFSIRIYFAESLDQHWIKEKHEREYQDIRGIKEQLGVEWTTKNQVFSIKFPKYGYKLKFRMNVLCDPGWYSLGCDYFCNRSSSHIVGCDDDLGTVCHSGYNPTKDGNCVWGDVCKMSPIICKNGGTCNSLPDAVALRESYQCACLKEYTGQHCEEHVVCRSKQKEPEVRSEAVKPAESEPEPEPEAKPDVPGFNPPSGGLRKDLHNFLQLCLKLCAFLSSLSVIKFMVETVWI